MKLRGPFGIPLAGEKTPTPRQRCSAWLRPPDIFNECSLRFPLTRFRVPARIRNMKITIELEADFGHPNNPRPISSYLISAVMEECQKMLKDLPLADFEVSSVRVAGK
jgi:hypothetical protein